jgi:hypothetical protein
MTNLTSTGHDETGFRWAAILTGVLVVGASAFIDSGIGMTTKRVTSQDRDKSSYTEKETQADEKARHAKVRLKMLDPFDNEVFVGESILAYKNEGNGVIRVYRRDQKEIQELIKVVKQGYVTHKELMKGEFWLNTACSLTDPATCCTTHCNQESCHRHN